MTGPFPTKIVKPIRPLSTQYHTPALDAKPEVADPDVVSLDELFSIWDFFSEDRKSLPLVKETPFTVEIKRQI